MERVIDFLKENTTSSMATCANNIPRDSVMEYAIVDQNLIFATGIDSIKAQNLSVNNKISVSVYNMPFFVTIDGTTTKATNDEIDAYNKILFERHPDFKEMVESGKMQPFTYYKLVPQTVYYNNYSKGMAPPTIIKL